jgi:hypothetical protein
MISVVSKTLLWAILLPTGQASAQIWHVGVERELLPGVYVKLLDEKNGWRLWQTDTKELTYCFAVKPAFGRSHPSPVGNDYFKGSFPYLKLSTNIRGGPEWEGGGRYAGDTATEWRRLGERFFEPVVPSETDLSAEEGRTLEINVVSYEDDVLHYGRSEDAGRFSLAGAREMTSRVKSCFRSKGKF